METKLLSYLPKFIEALRAQLTDDHKRWGETWRKRDLQNHEERIFNKFKDYYDQWETGGNPVPWLKIAGLAFIAWVRENFDDWKNVDIE